MNDKNNIKVSEFLENIFNDTYVITKKPRRNYKKNLKKFLIVNRKPQFMLCLLSKCPYINECWDWKQLDVKWKLDNDDCKFNDYWLKAKPKSIESYKEIKRYKFSNVELSILIALVRDLAKVKNQALYNELLNKLLSIDKLEGIKVEHI